MTGKQKFLIQFDNKSYTEKPNGNEIGKIKKRVQGSKLQRLTVEEILNKIQAGYSFSPGILQNGLKAKNWSEQQLFGVDIDNDDENEPILIPKEAIEICKDNNLGPLIVYHSFSSTKPKPKFRLIFALNEPTKEESKRKIIAETLISLFPQADKSCKNADRLFFGTNKKGKFNNNIITFDKILEFYKPEEGSEVTFSSELEKLKNNFDFKNYLINDLKLKVLSENESSIKFKKCPICGHNECFVYYKNTKSFYCYGKNGNKGGNIINFLMITKKLSKKEAVNYFKKELCHIESEKITHTPAPLYSAYDLMQKDIPEPYFCIENLIYQGLTIIAAPPKGYKSWFILYLCLCVAKGTDFLGFRTKSASVVYFALEDSDRRVRKQLQKVSNDGELPKNYYLVHRALNMEGGFVSDLEYYLEQDPKIKLLVIDTLQVVRGMYKNQNAYAKDYEDVRALKSFADKHNVCIIVVHHVKKDNKKDDLVFNRISGTNGIMGAADTALILDLTDKDIKEFTLHITGRDVEPDDLILQFNEGQWRCLGNAEIQVQKREERQYEENPLVIGIKRLLKKEEKWQGTAAELKDVLLKYNCELECNIAVMAKQLKKLTEQFKKYDDIVYIAPPKDGSNGKRIHKFEISSFGISSDAVIENLDDLFE